VLAGFGSFESLVDPGLTSHVHEGRFRRRSRTRRERCSGETPDAARMLGGCECEWLWLWIFHQRCWPFAVEWLSASSVFKVQYYYVVFDIEYHQKVVRLSTGQASRQPHYGESSDDWERVRRGIHGLD
jgi:hypothetical protein